MLSSFDRSQGFSSPTRRQTLPLSEHGEADIEHLHFVTFTALRIETWKGDIQIFTNLYSQDLPNPAGLSSELSLWERLWIEKRGKAEDIPDKIATVLRIVHRKS